jgi:hypothetical protein
MPFFSWHNSPQCARTSSLSRLHDLTHNTQYDSSRRVVSPTQRPLPDNTQHSQEADVHAPCGIRTRNPSKRAAADPSLRSRGRWDRRYSSHFFLRPFVHQLTSFHKPYSATLHARSAWVADFVFGLRTLTADGCSLC